MVLGIRTVESAGVQTQVVSLEMIAIPLTLKVQMMKALMGLICFHFRWLMKAGAGLIQPLHVHGQLATPGLSFCAQEWILLDVILDSVACETVIPMLQYVSIPLHALQAVHRRRVA